MFEWCARGFGMKCARFSRSCYIKEAHQLRKSLDERARDTRKTVKRNKTFKKQHLKVIRKRPPNPNHQKTLERSFLNNHSYLFQQRAPPMASAFWPTPPRPSHRRPKTPRTRRKALRKRRAPKPRPREEVVVFCKNPTRERFVLVGFWKV